MITNTMECKYTSTCKLFEGGTCKYAQEDSLCVRRCKLDFLFTKSLLPAEQFKDFRLQLDSDNSDLEAFDYLQTVQKNIASFVAGGNNLYLYSRTPGNGKTSWASKLLKQFIYQIWPESPMKCRALFINVPKFLLALKANISTPSEYIAHIHESIEDADLVIWDDIGTKFATEFEHEHLLSLIDARLSAGKTNIFTSNIQTDSLSEQLGDRLASRIVNGSRTVEFRGVDKRKRGVNA